MSTARCLPRFARWTIWAFLVFFAVPAEAGQLHVRRRSLAELADRGGHALFGTVKAVSPADGNDAEVTVEVSRILAKKPGVGEGEPTRTVTVYGGIVWDNPRKSPIDERLNGAIDPRSLTVGGTTILIVERGLGSGVEAIADTPANRRKVEVFFAANGVRDYTKKTPVDALTQDLGDADLGAFALAALAGRGKLNAARLVESSASMETLENYLEALPPRKQAAFFTQAARALKKLGNADRTDDVIRVAGQHLSKETAGPIAEMVALPDPATDDGHSTLSNFRTDLLPYLGEAGDAAAASARPYIDFMVRYTRHRRAYESDASDLKKFLTYLAPKDRTRAAAALLPIVHEDEDGVDGIVLHLAETSAVENPSPTLLGPLATLDPMRAEMRGSQEGILESLMKMGTAIARKFPKKKKKVAGLVEPHLRFGIEPEAEVLSAYRAAVGKAPFPAAETFLAKTVKVQLSPGGSFVDGAGFRVDVDPAFDEKGTLGFRVFQNKHESRGGSLGPEMERFREGVVAGRVWSASLESGRVTFVLRPVVDPAPEATPEPELYARGQKDAERAKCTDYVDHRYERWNGLFFYEAKTAGGKACHFVYGGFTGTRYMP